MIRRRADEPFTEGYHYEVDLDTGCWNWLRYVTYQGYGKCTANKRAGVSSIAHRESWRVANGPIPERLVIDHLCRNKRCINPEHLDCVRQAVNTWRGDRAKLTAADVETIRERIVAGDTMAQIGRDYGVHLDAIFRIAEDDRWREDPTAPRQPVRPIRDCPICGTRVEGNRKKIYCSQRCVSRMNYLRSKERIVRLDEDHDFAPREGAKSDTSREEDKDA